MKIWRCLDVCRLPIENKEVNNNNCNIANTTTNYIKNQIIISTKTVFNNECISHSVEISSGNETYGDGCNCIKILKKI